MGEGRGGKEERKRGREEEEKGRDRPPFRKFLDPPLRRAKNFNNLLYIRMTL